MEVRLAGVCKHHLCTQPVDVWCFAHELQRLAKQQKVTAGIPHGSGADRISPRVQLERIGQSVREMVAAQYSCLNEEVLPALVARGIVIRRAAELAGTDLRHVRDLFHREIFPVLTPLATDPSHPFPHLLNKSLNLAVALRRPGELDPLYAVVQVPGVLARFVQLPSSEPSPLIARP